MSAMKIGLLFAMEVEAAPFFERFASLSDEECCGVRLRRLTIAGHEAVTAVFGVGAVSAAACTQLVIDRFGCDLLLNAGGAGGIAPGLRVGDLVAASRFTFHDADMEMLSHYPPHRRSFDCDAPVTALLAEAAAGQGLRAVTGGVATGNTFVCDPAEAAAIHARTGCAAVEMEGAAIAQTAARAGVPFASLKAVTDRCEKELEELRYQKEMPYEKFAALLCGVLTDAIARL